MKQVVTVRGLINAQELGFCQCHEHLLIRKGTSYEINPSLWMDDVEKSASEAASFHDAGGRTIVDAQPIGCGRMELGLLDISQQSKIHIVASTGFHKMIFYPKHHWIFTISQKNLSKIYKNEILSGMYLRSEEHFPFEQSKIRAGFIKTALDKEGLSEQYLKCFFAAADACLESGASMMIHIEEGSDPLMLYHWLTDYGMPPEKLIFCHLDRACKDLDIHKKLGASGCFLEYDTIGRPKYHSDTQEIHLIKEMLTYGLENRLLISLDTTRDRLKAYQPDGPGLCYLLKTFLPELKLQGIPALQIHKMTLKNCQTALAINH